MSLRLISRPMPATAVSRETGAVLGGARLGPVFFGVLPDWPEQQILTSLFGSTATAIEETWWAGPITASGISDGLAWRRAGDLLYGVLTLDENDFSAANAGPALQLASREAYQRIFRLIDAQQLPHLWRVWNYLAGINCETDGLERYRQFNIGRQDAFIEFHRGASGNVPAACALGLAGGPLSIAFLAGARPAQPIENPRQVSAYDYPADYGPRSPTFSRAALVYPDGQEILFISGTASIVGHQTVHPGDVAGQCREALANIAAVIAEANRQNRTAPFALAECSYRVYVRHAADFALVRDTLQPLLGPLAEIIYVQADICRDDLLLEIEAMASHCLECA